MHTLHRAIRQTLTASMLASTALLSTPALSASFTWLTSPSLVGHVTFDAFLGNADDQVVNGINTIGAASQFSASNGVYGFFQGTHTALGSSILGLNNQVFFGSNVFGSIRVTGEWNNNAALLFNQPFAQSLDFASANSITINHDQSYTDSFVVNDSISGGRLQVTGAGHYLLNGQDPTTLYSGGLLTHFNFVTPLLPTNWIGVAQETENWSVLDGQFAGLTGVNTLTFYSTDSFSTPQEPPQPLGAPWVTTGFTAISGLTATVGNTTTPAVDGTATLSNGNIATLNVVELARNGNGTLTVQGTGTALSREDATYGHIFTQGSSNAALNVLDGGKVSSSDILILHFSQQASMDTHVSGVGSELNLSCPTGQDCSPKGVVGLFDLVLQNPSTSSTTTVDSGARINIIGKDTVSAGIALTGNGHVTVDGANSVIHITGSKTVQVGSKSVFGVGVITGIGIEQTDSVNVTNGARSLLKMPILG